MNFETKYTDLVKSKVANSAQLESAASQYVQEYNFSDADKWNDALAICDAALQTNNVTDNIKELYRQMYYHSWCHHPGMSMNEEDYKAWYEACNKVCDKFMEIGHPRAYVEKSDLLENPRRPYRDYPTAMEYMRKGIELGDVASMASYGYFLYFGIHGLEEDKEKGLELINKAKAQGYARADLYLVYIGFNTIENDDDLLAQINAYNDK